MNGDNKLLNSNEIKICYKALRELILGKEQNTSENKLYHYTSTKVLNSILEKGCFRASNIFYLNDKIEYKMGVDVLTNIFSDDEDIKSYLEDISKFNGRDGYGVYSISFSNKEDELQQWITYAKESGVCIELDSDVVWGNDDLKLGIKCNENSFMYFDRECFLKLAYEKEDILPDDKLPQLNADIVKRAFAKALVSEKQKEILDEAVVKIKWNGNDLLAKAFLKLLSVYFKEERFRGEGEIRAAFLPAQKSVKSVSKIEYFEQTNGILRPYMDVYFKHKGEGITPYEDECPIKAITIGPGGNQANVFDSVVHRLEYGNCKIWKYNMEELGKRLSEYVLGCLSQYRDEINNEEYFAVVEALVSRWCYKKGYSYQIKEATRVCIEVNLSQDNAGATQNDECSEKIEKIFNEIQESNYFTLDGIWVKKSSLSYIF